LRGLNYLSVIGLVLMTMGCVQKAGHEFVRPDPERLLLGKTTKQEVLASYGEPQSRKNFTTFETQQGADTRISDFDSANAPGSYSVLTYAYVESNPRITGGAIDSKRTNFSFFDDVLIGYSFVSSFANTSTDFSEAKIGQLQKGTMSKADVVALLGKPDGEMMFPGVKNIGDSTFFYGFHKLDTSGGQILNKSLVILFDQASHIKDVRFASNSEPWAPAVGSSGGVPVFIPVPKK